MHGYTKEGLDDFIHFQGVIVHLQKVHYKRYFSNQTTSLDPRWS
jgi:hypothetical protein